MALPRTSLLARAPIVDRLSGGLQKAWDREWLKPIALEPEILWKRAAKKQRSEDEFSGRSEADVRDFRERLDTLCSSLNKQAQLSPLGRAAAHGQLVRAIRQRFELGRLWRETPEILQAELAPPILVIGQMRSGTTRIHRLLAADPEHAATRFCDSWNPAPIKPDLRPLWSSGALFMARRLNPWIDAIHPFGSARVDEELGWLASALNHCAYEAQWHIPDYVAFSETRDPAPIYREFARILRTDAAHHRNADFPRVMKVPQFAEDLDALITQFPDARLVVARRSPEDTLRSSISMVANQMAMQSTEADLDWIKRECARKIGLRSERMDNALRSFKGPVVEVDFDRLGSDWRSEVSAIYAGLGLPLSETALLAMEKEQARAEGGSHGLHQSHMSGMN